MSSVSSTRIPTFPEYLASREIDAPQLNRYRIAIRDALDAQWITGTMDEAQDAAADSSHYEKFDGKMWDEEAPARELVIEVVLPGVTPFYTYLMLRLELARAGWLLEASTRRTYMHLATRGDPYTYDSVFKLRPLEGALPSHRASPHR